MPSCRPRSASPASCRSCASSSITPVSRPSRLEPWTPGGHTSPISQSCPNVAAKLSGLLTEAGAGWTTETLRPYADHLLGAFGADRVMFGSDWPVCTLRTEYRGVLSVSEQLVEECSAVERAAVFGGTARGWYGLDPVQ